MIVYRINVLEELKKAGYNSTVIWHDNILSQSVMQRLRTGEMIGMKSLNRICELLNRQPGEIVEYVPDPRESEE
ncbi:MAG: helix-turn-helix domain-containing protein [Acutalibacteraceae bacterium]|nr:helix-turn-helix domain-containing protein [Acutalibacteraceae bacterium]